MTRLLSIVPFPPRLDAPQGGPRALAELLTRLAERMPVALVTLRTTTEPPVDEVLLERCDVVREIERPTPQRWIPPPCGHGRRARPPRARVGARAGSPAMHEAVAETARTWRPDVAQVEFGVMAQYVPSLPHALPTVLVVHDLAEGSPVIDADADVGERLRERLDRRAWARFERDAFGRADVAVVFSERDRRLVQAVTSRPRVEVIPLGITPGAPLDPEGTEQAVVFVGSFVHPPNVDAARFLVTEILPHVRSAVPDVTTYIVGDAPPATIRQLAGDGVVVTGRVASVQPYLDRAAVVVAPVRLGGGMRVKVLDALGAGKALVATPLGVSGLAIDDGVHALVRDGAAPFGQAVAALLRDPGRRRALATSARAWAERSSSWEATADAYERSTRRSARLRATGRAQRESRDESPRCAAPAPIPPLPADIARPSGR